MFYRFKYSVFYSGITSRNFGPKISLPELEFFFCFKFNKLRFYFGVLAKKKEKEQSVSTTAFKLAYD